MQKLRNYLNPQCQSISTASSVHACFLRKEGPMKGLWILTVSFEEDSASLSINMNFLHWYTQCSQPGGEIMLGILPRQFPSNQASSICAVVLKPPRCAASGYGANDWLCTDTHTCSLSPRLIGPLTRCKVRGLTGMLPIYQFRWHQGELPFPASTLREGTEISIKDGNNRATSEQTSMWVDRLHLH